MPFERRRLQLQRLAHRGQQAFDRLHSGRNLAALDAAYRALVGTGTQRQTPLTKAMLSPYLSYET